jgi:hypothetical protein
VLRLPLDCNQHNHSISRERYRLAGAVLERERSCIVEAAAVVVVVVVVVAVASSRPAAASAVAAAQPTQ